jgi:redox-sensitive bicupin YhaK (pirin superfamily)
VKLKRVFGFSQVPAFDPFLLLDDFRSDTPEHYLQGFPWHPHRGIETITYVLAGTGTYPRTAYPRSGSPEAPPPGSSEGRRRHTAFAYVIEGRGYFCGEKDPFSYEAEGSSYFDLQREPFAGDGTLVLFGDGDEIAVSTGEQPVRFLLISGRPLGEPVAWYGPIVMNTGEELRAAFREYREGTFIKSTRP